ncbi:MAG: membrane protein YczE [Acidimicrobiales bacterium]
MTATFRVSRRELARRLPRLFLGLVVCGVGIALMLSADLGLGPWDVFHQGLAERTGLSTGTAVILVGITLLLLWIPLRERPGIGTVANAVLIGATVDVSLVVLPEPAVLWQQVAFVCLGTFLFGPGSGLYIGAGLGSGPRDGLMTGIARRGPSVRLVRTSIELSALGLGLLLGGTVGFGTILFALTVGPNVQFFLERLAVDRHPPETAAEIG